MLRNIAVKDMENLFYSEQKNLLRKRNVLRDREHASRFKILNSSKYKDMISMDIQTHIRMVSMSTFLSRSSELVNLDWSVHQYLILRSNIVLTIVT